MELWEQAGGKLDQEEAAFASAKPAPSNMAKVVREDVQRALVEFCRQSEPFAKAVIDAEGTLKECCEAVVKGVRDGISDHEAFRRAVRFYLPDAEVQFRMEILLPGAETAGAGTGAAKQKRKISIDLFD